MKKFIINIFFIMKKIKYYEILWLTNMTQEEIENHSRN